MQHRSPTRLSPGDWISVIKGGWARASQHNMGLIAAGVAFYLFLAMVPLLGAIVMLYGIVARPETVATHIAELSQALPAAAAEIVTGQIQGLVETRGSTKGFAFLTALALALFGARNGAGSMIIALNVAFGCPEGRGFVKKNLMALAVTVGGALAAVVLFAGIGAFGALQAFVAPDSVVLGLVAQLATWAVLILALATFIALLFRYGPACQTPSLRWLTPGSLFAAFVAAALTFGFGAYVANFGNYNATYGALGGVVVLLTWMWLTSYVVLIGAECDVALMDREDTPDPSPRPS
ncbi:YihY/virulence factor BrkB family protein [Croceicoccus naphthovorans]|uniref:Uncharacterized protein n=1 Tax=Croceicoccus naphthovorans TaxID=1348774 RepID=A0A0G3XIH2_9SPHN|nr:YihY/virulence factor BrkB family protein [Croceicoccus naphthovorans]AKM10133.1 hypothetical protein AB433_09345 [Croceicoccus naphthovorans]MBB3991577.1 membrane protein [Croceicoccus naphthovorans]